MLKFPSSEPVHDPLAALTPTTDAEVKTTACLLRERVAICTPEWASAITGIDAARIRQLAREMGDTAVQARPLASFPGAIQPMRRPAFSHRPGATARGTERESAD